MGCFLVVKQLIFEKCVVSFAATSNGKQLAKNRQICVILYSFVAAVCCMLVEQSLYFFLFRSYTFFRLVQLATSVLGRPPKGHFSKTQ